MVVILRIEVNQIIKPVVIDIQYVRAVLGDRLGHLVGIGVEAPSLLIQTGADRLVCSCGADLGGGNDVLVAVKLLLVILDDVVNHLRNVIYGDMGCLGYLIELYTASEHVSLAVVFDIIALCGRAHNEILLPIAVSRLDVRQISDLGGACNGSRIVAAVRDRNGKGICHRLAVDRRCFCGTGVSEFIVNDKLECAGGILRKRLCLRDAILQQRHLRGRKCRQRCILGQHELHRLACVFLTVARNDTAQERAAALLRGAGDQSRRQKSVGRNVSVDKCPSVLGYLKLPTVGSRGLDRCVKRGENEGGLPRPKRDSVTDGALAINEYHILDVILVGLAARLAGRLRLWRAARIRSIHHALGERKEGIGLHYI